MSALFYTHGIDNTGSVPVNATVDMDKALWDAFVAQVSAAGSNVEWTTYEQLMQGYRHLETQDGVIRTLQYLLRQP